MNGRNHDQFSMRRWPNRQALRLLLLWLLVASTLTSTVSYAQEGGQAPSGDAPPVEEPPPSPEADGTVTPPHPEAEQVLHIAEVTLASAEDLARLEELGYACAMGEPCQIEASEAQLQSLRDAGLEVTATGISVQGSWELAAPDEPCVYGENWDPHNIPNPGWLTSAIDISSAPSGAKVTRVEYGCQVYQFPETRNGPGEYVLGIRPSSMSSYYTIWDRLGGSTDQGHDDDPEDDDDIVLYSRWIYSHFDGQSVNQPWYLKAEDQVLTLFPRLSGYLYGWYLRIYYCPSAPSAPVLVAPAYDSHTCDTTPAFDWWDVTLAKQYWIQVDDSSSFSSPAIDRGTATSGYTPITPLAAGHYYWRVRCRNECGWGAWSTVQQFDIDQLPAVPVPQSPADGSRTCHAAPTFIWATATGATSYRIQAARSSAFAPGELAVDATTSLLYYTPTTPLEPRLWCWRVRGESACGSSDYAAARCFTLDAAPAVPSSPSPAQGATGVSLEADLDWADAAGATSYDVYFGTSAIPPFAGNVTSSGYSLPKLSANTRYYWGAVAKNAQCQARSEVWYFTTGSSTNQPPENYSLWPDHGGRPADRRVNFTATYRDRDGWRDLQQVYLQIGLLPTKRLGCRLRYDVRRDKLYLTDNNGASWLGGYAPGSANGIRNRRCTLNCAKSTVVKSGRTVKVTWNLAFRTAFRGLKNSYMQARDIQGATTPWQKMGTWRVQ